MKPEVEVKMIEWFDSRFYKIKYQKEDVEICDYFASVTTKLGIISKPFLAHWRGSVGNREADLRSFEASERGVRIHSAWYSLTTGGAVLYNPFQNPNYSKEEIEKLQEEYLGNVSVVQYQDEMYDVFKLKRWLEIVKPKIILSEKTVYSLKNKDAGTLDNLMEIEEGKYLVSGKEPIHIPGGIYVVDLKSGKEVDENANMQTACYADCVEEMEIAKIEGTLILHTGSKVRNGIEGLSTILRNKDEMRQDYSDYRLASALWERKNADARPRVFEFPSLLTMKEK